MPPVEKHCSYTSKDSFGILIEFHCNLVMGLVNSIDKAVHNVRVRQLFPIHSPKGKESVRTVRNIDRVY